MLTLHCNMDCPVSLVCKIYYTRKIQGLHIDALLSLKPEMPKLKKIDQLFHFLECVTKCIVSLPGKLRFLCTTLDCASNDINFKNILFTKFTVKLK